MWSGLMKRSRPGGVAGTSAYFAFCSYLPVIQSAAFKPRVRYVFHIRTTSWSSNQPTLDIWLAILSAPFEYTITARLR